MRNFRIPLMALAALAAAGVSLADEGQLPAGFACKDGKLVSITVPILQPGLYRIDIPVNVCKDTGKPKTSPPPARSPAPPRSPGIHST